MEIPEGYEEVEARVFRKGDDLMVVGSLQPEGPFLFSLKLKAPVEDFGPPPTGFEWTGEVRPPRKGEFFWSELRGRVIEAIEDETGLNRFGEPTGGRRILRVAADAVKAIEPVKPKRPALRLVKNEPSE